MAGHDQAWQVRPRLRCSPVSIKVRAHVVCVAFRLSAIACRYSWHVAEVCTRRVSEVEPAEDMIACVLAWR